MSLFFPDCALRISLGTFSILNFTNFLTMIILPSFMNLVCVASYGPERVSTILSPSRVNFAWNVRIFSNNYDKNIKHFWHFQFTHAMILAPLYFILSLEHFIYDLPAVIYWSPLTFRVCPFHPAWSISMCMSWTSCYLLKSIYRVFKEWVSFFF